MSKPTTSATTRKARAAGREEGPSLLASPLLRKVAAHALLAGAVIVASGYGLSRLKRHVSASVAVPAAPPAVELLNRPAWMTDTLAEEIAATVRPTSAPSSIDADLLREVHESLSLNPWVREVRRVRRAFGRAAGDTLQIDCEYRAPIALVATGRAGTGGGGQVAEYVLVDGDGVKLPGRFPAVRGELPRVAYGPDGHVTLRVIEGVVAPAPLADGAKWAGEDLMAGLDLARLLYNRACADEVVRINVGNYKGRRNPRDPQIVLVTRHNTAIWWGEPVRQSFYAELSPTEKLERLALLKQRYGRVDAGFSWIDIRLDQVQYPQEEANRIVQGHAPTRGPQ